MGIREHNFILSIPCIVINLFVTLNQQNAQYFSLDIDIVIVHLIFSLVSFHKGIALVWFPDDGPLRTETCRNN